MVAVEVWEVKAEGMKEVVREGRMDRRSSFIVFLLGRETRGVAINEL